MSFLSYNEENKYTYKKMNFFEKISFLMWNFES